MQDIFSVQYYVEFAGYGKANINLASSFHVPGEIGIE